MTDTQLTQQLADRGIIDDEPSATPAPTDEPLLVSVDVETTGGTPSVGELLSIGAVVLSGSIREATLRVPALDTSWIFSVNLAQVNGRSEASTMKWWDDFPAAYAMHRDDTVRPVEAMHAFEFWLKQFKRKPIFVAWPAAFDWQFINSYFWQYRGGNPFGYSPMCMKNYAMGLTGNIEGILGSRKDAEFPPGFVIEPEELGLISHVALDDAWTQAVMLINLLEYGTESREHHRPSGSDPVRSGSPDWGNTFPRPQ